MLEEVRGTVRFFFGGDGALFPFAPQRRGGNTQVCSCFFDRHFFDFTHPRGRQLTGLDGQNENPDHGTDVPVVGFARGGRGCIVFHQLSNWFGWVMKS